MVVVVVVVRVGVDDGRLRPTDAPAVAAIVLVVVVVGSQLVVVVCAPGRYE